MRLIEGTERDPNIYFVADKEGVRDSMERCIASMAMAYFDDEDVNRRMDAEEIVLEIAQYHRIPSTASALLWEMWTNQGIVKRQHQIFNGVRKAARQEEYICSRHILEELRDLRSLTGEDIFATANGLMGYLSEQGVKPHHWSIDGFFKRGEESTIAAIEATGADHFAFQFEIVHNAPEVQYELQSKRIHRSLGKVEDDEFVPFVTVLDEDHPVRSSQ